MKKNPKFFLCVFAFTREEKNSIIKIAYLNLKSSLTVATDELLRYKNAGAQVSMVSYLKK